MGNYINKIEAESRFHAQLRSPGRDRVPPGADEGDVSNLRAHLLGSHTYNWARDQHVLGAYSYIPVNGLVLPSLLGAPIAETLFFAGEATATDAQMGTVFGAFESGLRAANELLKA